MAHIPPAPAPAIPSQRIFIAGNSGSGKTTLAERLFLSKIPRVLILDMTGEWEGRVDVTAETVPEVVTAIQARARAGGRWRVSLSLDPDELPALVRWLIPVPDVKRSPVVALGGMAVLVDEVDLLAPPGTAQTHIRTLYRRSRHVGLTVVSTTQRPANVSREVSAQSTYAVALGLSEPRDVKYIADLMRWDRPEVHQWQRWNRQNRHGAIVRDLRTGHHWTVNDRGELAILRPPQSSLDLNDDDDAEEPAGVL